MNQKSETHKAEVYRLARRLVLGRGVRSWNMDDLAAEAGITKRTLYRIVPAKEPLVAEVLIDHVKEVQARLRAEIEGGAGWRSTLESIAVMLPEAVIGVSPAALREILLEYPAVRTRLVALRGELTEALLAFLQEGARLGHFKGLADPGMLIECAQAIVIHFISQDLPRDVVIEKMGRALAILIDGSVSSGAGK